MAKLIMTRGLPGSGKSFWAKAQEGFVVISKDDIRSEFEKTGWKWSRENEKDILARQAQMILICLKNGQNVIAADTNFGKHEARLKAIADQAGAGFAVRDFSEVPLDVCLDRNKTRGDGTRVPPEAIFDMYAKYIEPFVKVEPVTWVEGLPTCVLCDLDGTLAIHVARGPYEEEKCETDAMDRHVCMVLEALKYAGHEIIFLSGRKDSCRTQTQNWLDNHGWDKQTLLMRAADDNRNDAIVKNDIFDKNIRGVYNVVCVLDDRDRVVKRWRELGLKCLQVNYGAF